MILLRTASGDSDDSSPPALLETLIRPWGLFSATLPPPALSGPVGPSIFGPAPVPTRGPPPSREPRLAPPPTPTVLLPSLIASISPLRSPCGRRELMSP